MTPPIEGEVVLVMAAGSCEVVFPNAIAVAFVPPSGWTCRLNDRIRFTGLLDDEGRPVHVQNVSQGWSADTLVPHNDIHDLRIPIGHGVPRTPTKARLFGE
jgi:hypothetical protein